VSYSTVDRDDTPVLYVSRPDALPDGPKEAFAELEGKLGALRGRKFYGAFYPATGDYRACVERTPEDDPAQLDLQEDVLPGGRYLKETLKGEPPQLYGRIGPAFEAMLAAAEGDESRPSLEFYRRHDEVVLLLPTRG
jgi:hypothetical protein